MCGRFTLTNPTDELAGYFDVLVNTALAPRYNIAPTQPVACVRSSVASNAAPLEGSASGSRELVEMRWGLIPYWAKDPVIGSRMINARSESVAEKPAYRDAFRKRRCLVVADGFYEWRRLGGTKQPYFIHMKDRRPFGFAGLWERWKPRPGGLEKIVGPGRPEIPMSSDGRVESCTFLTVGPNELMEPIHERMPVILRAEHWDEWLDPGQQDAAALSRLLLPFTAGEMEAYPVSTRVNRPANDDPACIEPLPEIVVVRPESDRDADAGEDEAGSRPPTQNSLF